MVRHVTAYSISVQSAPLKQPHQPPPLPLRRPITHLMRSDWKIPPNGVTNGAEVHDLFRIILLLSLAVR